MKAPTFPCLLNSHLRLPDEETLIFSPQGRRFHLVPNTYRTPMPAWWYSCAEGHAVIVMMGGRGGCGKCVSSCEKQKEGLFWRVHCCSVQCGGPPSPRGRWDPPEVSYVPTATLQHVLSGISLKPHARGSLKRQAHFWLAVFKTLHLCGRMVSQPDAENGVCVMERRIESVPYRKMWLWIFLPLFQFLVKENTRTVGP